MRIGHHFPGEDRTVSIMFVFVWNLKTDLLGCKNNNMIDDFSAKVLTRQRYFYLRNQQNIVFCSKQVIAGLTIFYKIVDGSPLAIQ